jgi:predicted N-acetyltransferase YhbS
MSTLDIAAWQSRDNKRIVEILEASRPGRDYDPIDEAGLTEMIERSEHFNAGGALVARVTGDVAGFVLAISSPAPSQGYLCALMVDPSHQGQGVGAQLLVGAEDFLRGSGTQQVCVAPEDSPAMFWLGVNMATSA